MNAIARAVAEVALIQTVIRILETEPNVEKQVAAIARAFEAATAAGWFDMGKPGDINRVMYAALCEARQLPGKR